MLLTVPNSRKLYANVKSASKSALNIELFFENETLVKLDCLDEEELPGVSETRKIFK